MIPPADLDRISRDLAERFDYPVHILPALPEPEAAYDEKRGQFNSALILRDAVQTCPPDAWRLLALTRLDLFIPMLSFVFGQAQLGGRVALVSLARLHQEFYQAEPNPAIFAARTRKEIFHELGHTIGLTHCPDPTCPMSLSTSIIQVDVKTDRYCRACSAQIRGSRVRLLQTENHA